MTVPPEGRIQRVYDNVARFGLNFFILLVLLNLVALVITPHLQKTTPERADNVPVATDRPYTTVQPKDADEGRPGLTRRRDWESLQWVDLRALKDFPPADVDAVLDEFGDFGHRGYSYEPYVGFAPYPTDGKVLTVDATEPEFAHRRSDPPQGRRDAQASTLQVYVLGGSTTFGIYVADGWTWPSYLWDCLQSKSHQMTPPREIQVTNFGRPYYYSTQEVALLARLLKTGHRPDVVIFMDGLNDCFMPFWENHPDAPMFTTKMAGWIHMAQFGKDWLSQYQWIPMVKLAYALHSRLMPARAEPAGVPPTTDQVADRIVASYRDNVKQARALCSAYGVQPIFFWQPCPFYHYDMSLQRRTFLIPPPMYEVFNKAYERVGAAVPDAHFLGDSLTSFGTQTPAFVDNFHYSPAFNRYLAQRVTDAVTLPLKQEGTGTDR